MDPAKQKRPSPDELVEELADGRRRLHDLPQGLTPKEAADARRRAMERIRAVELSKIGAYALDAARASTQHCENFIGAAQVPMGVVGPLRV